MRVIRCRRFDFRGPAPAAAFGERVNVFLARGQEVEEVHTRVFAVWQTLRRTNSELLLACMIREGCLSAVQMLLSHILRWCCSKAHHHAREREELVPVVYQAMRALGGRQVVR